MTRFSIRSFALLLLVAVGAPTVAAQDNPTPSATTEQSAVEAPSDVEESSQEASDGEADTATENGVAADAESLADTTQNAAADTTDGNENPTVGDNEDGGFGWTTFGLLLIPVLLVAGGLYYFLSRRNQTPAGQPTHVAPDFSQQGARLPVSGSSQAAAMGRLSEKSEVEQLRDTVARLETAIGSLTSRIDRLEQSAPPQRQPSPTPSVPIAPPTAPAQMAPQSPDQKLAAGFVKWCRERGPLASKMDMFASYVATAMPGATVEHVYRDLDSTVRPLRFGTNPGNAPADYWVVHVEGQSLLLPMPLGPAQFKDLNPAFEGSAVPATLQTFVPARVQNEGGQYALVQPGRIG